MCSVLPSVKPLVDVHGGQYYTKSDNEYHSHKDIICERIHDYEKWDSHEVEARYDLLVYPRSDIKEDNAVDDCDDSYVAQAKIFSQDPVFIHYDPYRQRK